MTIIRTIDEDLVDFWYVLVGYLHARGTGQSLNIILN